jgi:hypothetical protein
LSEYNKDNYKVHIFCRYFMINLFGVFNHFLKSFEPPNQLMPPPLNELEESGDPKFYPPSLLLENNCPKFDPPWLLLEYCPKSCCSKLNP